MVNRDLPSRRPKLNACSQLNSGSKPRSPMTALRFMGNPFPNLRLGSVFTVTTTTGLPWRLAFWAPRSRRRFLKRNDVSRRLDRTGGMTWRTRYTDKGEEILEHGLTTLFRSGSRSRALNSSTCTPLLGLSVRRLPWSSFP